MSKKALTHLSSDPPLKNIIDSINLDITKSKNDVYGALVRSIISQQLSVKAAATIYGRFLDLFKKNYPHPKEVTIMETEAMRQVGLSRQKSGYIKNVAHFFQDEKIIEKDWSNHSDEEVIKTLTQIKGVGTWTVEMILMFTLDRPDVFPVGDLGIQNAMITLYKIKEEKKVLQSRLIEIAEKWRPHRTLACRYLWQWKDS
jgi:DNA-3-methyladenine glycosylase II